jgi:acetylornithine deacetylase
LELSAVHQAMRWGTRSLDHVASLAHLRFGGLTGLRFNIGRVEGGIKGNVIAPSAELRFGFRPLPSQSFDALHETFRGFADAASLDAYEETFCGPCLPSGDIAAAEERRLQARDLADALDMPIGNAVDFWTEASLFSAAGLTALVYGPGDIAQAHAADEWVALDQLAAVATTYYRLMGGRNA